jgi:hypothetical protein
VEANVCRVGCDTDHAFEQLRDIFVRDREVAMTTLGMNRNQTCVEQASQVSAAGLFGNSRVRCQLSRRERTTRHQGGEHLSAHGIADRCRDARDVGPVRHSSIHLVPSVCHRPLFSAFAICDGFIDADHVLHPL